MKQRDYYELLNINRRTSIEEIKIKYRKLAKKLHPDANLDDPTAEEKFKELTAAYDTLTNKEKKKKYDRLVLKYGYGVISKTENAAQKKEARERSEFKHEVKSTSAVVGDIINTILGIGKDAKAVVMSTAGEIKTKIEAQKIPKKGGNIEASLEITIEEGFFGVEKKLSVNTFGEQIKNYSVNVPRGIKDGEKIRLAALGKNGKNGGKNGDLIITIKLKNQNELKLDGTDILFNINISYVQSVIGDKISLRIFKESVDVQIPENTREKDKITIVQKGYYIDEKSRGNLIVILNIINPKEITERERKIYEQLLRVEKQKINK